MSDSSNQKRKILSLPTEANRQKYRPVFSASLLQHIEVLARTDYMKNNSAKSLAIVGIVSPFLAKIEAGAINPAYTESGKTSLLESLGAPAPENSKPEQSKEKYWKACYEKVIADPLSATIVEINAANEHRYLNGLMSIEEVQEFEEMNNTHRYK